MNPRALKAILYGGLIAGTLDVFAPALIYRISPLGVLRFIAGGVLGLPAARASGLAGAGLGLLLQWAMSLVIAAVFVHAATRLRWMTRRWLLAGIAYGVVVFCVMNYVVRPLSMIASMPTMQPYDFIANLAAMWLFGAIVAYFTQRQLQRA